MKKISLFLVFLAFTLLITGCGVEKKLVCTMTEEEDGIKISMESIIYYNGEKSTKIAAKSDMEFPLTKTALIKTYESFIKSELDKQTSDGMNYETSVNGQHLYLNMNIDPTKMTREQLDELDYEDFTKSYFDLKMELEEDGWTCK